MKKMLKSLMLVAVAAMAFAGCSKEDVSDNAQPGSGTKTVRGFVAEIATSRTTLNEAATRMKWTAGDQLGFYTDVATDLNVASSTYADGASNFTAEIDTKATKVYAYYPYFGSQMVDKDTPRTHENVSLYIQEAQTQAEAGVLDGQWVGMYASADLVAEQNTVLTFTPIASLIAFNIYDLENNGDKVKSVTFTPAGGEKLNGQTIYNLETGVTASTGTKTSAAVTLTTPYAVPAAKPADKTGYIYLAVSPKNYAGGTFTVATDKGSYDFVTTSAIDASNVFSVFTVPMNLAKVRKPAPTVAHVFYDDFSKATGNLADFSMKVSPADYAYYYTDPYTSTGYKIRTFYEAIAMGSGSAVSTITTPALKLIEGTKNLKVTFYANGWVENQVIKVTAAPGTVKGGDELVMPAKSTSSMDKTDGALFTIYVENADPTTTLTFALGNTVENRFVLDDLTVDVHEGPIVIAPVIIADAISGVAAAGVTEATFTYDIRNDENYTATVGCDGTVVTAASVDDATKTVTYTVSENTDTANARDGWIDITLNDAAATSTRIAVSQLKKVVVGDNYTLATWNFTTGAAKGSGVKNTGADDVAANSYFYTNKIDGSTYTLAGYAVAYNASFGVGTTGLSKYVLFSIQIPLTKAISTNNTLALDFETAVSQTNAYEWTVYYSTNDTYVIGDESLKSLGTYTLKETKKSTPQSLSIALPEEIAAGQNLNLYLVPTQSAANGGTAAPSGYAYFQNVVVKVE